MTRTRLLGVEDAGVGGRHGALSLYGWVPIKRLVEAGSGCPRSISLAAKRCLSWRTSHLADEGLPFRRHRAIHRFDRH